MVPENPGAAKKFSVAMLLFGVALLWLVPLGGALLLGTAGLGLTILWEAQTGGPSAPSSATTTETNR